MDIGYMGSGMVKVKPELRTVIFTSENVKVVFDTVKVFKQNQMVQNMKEAGEKMQCMGMGVKCFPIELLKKGDG